MKIWIIVLSLQISNLAQCQCLRIEGVITDLMSGQFVEKATVLFRKQTDGTNPVEQQINKRFTLDIPCEVSALEFRAHGFYPLVVPLNWPSESIGAYFVPLQLRPIDRQLLNQPYAQSEQKAYLMGQNQQSSSAKAWCTFTVKDAISGAELEADICLFYTQSGKKKCLSISSKTNQSAIVLSEPDIIAIEAKAVGYEVYQGNLILDRLDNRVQTYQLRLNRAWAILSAYQTDSIRHLRYVWRSAKGRIEAFHERDAKRQYLFVPAGVVGQVEVQDSKKHVLRTWSIASASGLLCYSLTPTVSDRAPVLASIDMPIHTPTIYFDQSEFKLRPDMYARLDSLGNWLRIHSDRLIRVVGNTDNVGSRQLNQTLSEFRARTVCQYLQSRGVLESQLIWLGLGDKKPVSPHEVEANRHLNRRVIFEFIIPDND